jgi:hypothetical protein
MSITMNSASLAGGSTGSVPVGGESIASRDKATLWVALTILILTGAFLMAYSNSKLLWEDEILSYYTVRQPSLAAMLHFQHTTPIAFEPPANEILLYLSGSLGNFSRFSLRLPSILSFLLLQICLFGFVKPIAGRRAACLAMFLPIGMRISVYATEARPYALLMAMSMAALCCWQTAARRGRFRKAALVGLSATLIVAITCQFYGILIALPLLVAEVDRWRRERHIDMAMGASMLFGFFSLVLVLPFWMTLLPYKQNVPRDAGLGWHSLLQTYYYLVLPSPGLSDRLTSHSFLAACILFLAGALLYAASYRQAVRRRATAQWLALVALTLLPCLAVAIAYLTVGTYQPRHCIEAAVGIAALLAIALARPLSALSLTSALAAIVIALVIGATVAVKLVQHRKSESLAQIVGEQPSAVILAALDSNPNLVLYMTAQECDINSLYINPQVLQRMRCVTSSEFELSYMHLTLAALAEHTAFPVRVVSYRDMRQQLPALLLPSAPPWDNWIITALQQDGVRIDTESKGTAVQLYRIGFPSFQR